ncbi:MAG: hypothetical protein NTY35_10030 [Planctomycetota bacterium]|nr:hypothetical protein [Planctomycetota bacterium]
MHCLKTTIWTRTALIAAAVLAPPSHAQTVLVAGAGPGEDRLVVLDLAGAPAWTPAWGQAIELLPVDSSARTPLDDLATTRPRLRTDVQNASRLELPNGAGSIYHHRRTVPDVGWVYGWFHVDPAGVPHLLYELPQPIDTPIDPFLARVAVARDGSSVLVATRLEAGGDLLELALDGSAPRTRTSASPPLEVLPNGLGFGAGFALAVCRDRVLRWTTGVEGDAQVVPFAEIATWFGDGLAISANGMYATCVGAEQGPEASRPFVVAASGTALPAGSTRTRYAGSGAAPETLDGPWLAVSDDGARVAWRAFGTGAYRGELYVGTAAVQPAPAEQVTRTEVFEPYLDEVAVFMFLPGGRLLFAAGEAPTTSGAGIQQADLFLMDPALGAASTRNLTNSSGNPVPPFLQQPALNPERILWAPEAQSYLLTLPATPTQHGRLLRVGPQGVDMLQDEAAGLPLVERSGTDLVLALADENPDDQEFKRWPATLLGQDLDVASAVDERALDLVIGPGGRGVLVTEENNGVQSLWRVTIGTGTALRLRSWAQGFGPAVTFLPDGTIVATLDSGTGTVVGAWPPASRMVRLLSSTTRAAVLPGGAR